MEALRGGSRALQDQPRGGEVREGALVFIGFMGSGKSTAATEYAQALRLPAIDSDVEIEARLGMSIAELFAKQGEASFRESEEQVVLELLDATTPQTVISLGGGSVLSQRVQRALSRHLVVLLDIDADSAWGRVASEAAQRPLAQDRREFEALHRAREPLYSALADAILPAEVPQVALRAQDALNGLRCAPRGTKLLWASAASGEYPVLIGDGLVTEGLVAQGSAAAAAWPLDRERSRPFCVTDSEVGALYRDRLGALAGGVEFPAGESQKTIVTAQRVWESLIEAEITRADHLVALGGGVVGDLAGFCAASYQRGMPYVQVPTTLVAQVDSAYGGKTGVDLLQGKNYVGAYHQPSGVIVDPRTLHSLPSRELSAGWVEVAKTALIAGGELWQRVSAEQPLDERTIMLCAKAKIEIVASDERDSGARQALNLGHTIGHAIETATGYTRYLHGEAVGLGLLAALRLSGAEDLREQIRTLMRAQGLPTRLDGAGVEEVLAASRRDKKRLTGEVPFVLLSTPGEVRIGQTVAAAEVRDAVAELASEP